MLLINWKFLCEIPFKVISFIVSVVTLCDIFFFILDLTLMFFLQNRFKLKNKIHAYFRCCLFSCISQ